MATDLNFALAERYLPVLDEVYKAESKTTILDGANSRVRFTGGDSVEIFKIAVNGLGTYNRNSGYASGAATGSWEKKTLTQDRGRSILIDRMTNEETLDMAVGSTLGELLRTQIIPEIDALNRRAA